MRLLQRGRRMPRTKTIRPAEPYLASRGDEARRLGHGYVGTELVLSALARRPDGTAAARLLGALGLDTASVDDALACWREPSTLAAKIDPQALATPRIDFDAVRDRLEQNFGPGALRTHACCLPSASAHV